MERNDPKILITDKAARSLRSGHPWVYADEVLQADAACGNGQIVDVCTRGGHWLGAGFYNSASKIRVRVLSRNANDRFDEAQLVIDPKLTVVGDQRGEGYQVEAMLYDAQGQQLLDSVLKADAVPMLNLDHKAAIMNDRNPQRGYPKWGWMTAQVKRRRRPSGEVRTEA